MAIVIDALSLVRTNKRLPTEAFFVDTNVVIAFADPFSRSIELRYATLNAEITKIFAGNKINAKAKLYDLQCCIGIL